MKTFAFGPEFQRALLRLAMIDPSFCHKSMMYVRPSFFTSRPLGWIFIQMRKYYREFESKMSDMVLRECATKDPGYLIEAEAVIATRVADADYIRSQLQEFVRRNIFARAHEESQQLYNDGQHVKAYDLMCKAMDELRAVDFEAVDRSWLFDELPQRMKRRYHASRDPTEGVYPTGIEAVDDIMGGGPKRGETHLILAPPKMGKTLWLIDKGFVATRVLRKPVLYINLEGNTKLIEDRFDSCFSTELYTQVKRGEIRPALYNEMSEEYRQLRGLLVIRTLNDFDVTILHVASEVKELESVGFEPELILIDYVDLMRSRNEAGTETQHQIDSMRDLKRFSNRGYCIWSACATQRPKEGDDEREFLWKSSNIANAYDKIRVADGYGSLNATREERERGECRYYLENYRDAAVGRVYRLHNENDRMRIAVTVKEEKMVSPGAKKRSPSKAGSVAGGPGGGSS